MSYVVVVADKLNERGLADLEATPGFEVIKAMDDPDKLRAALPRAHALVVRSATRVTETLLAKAPHLKVIGRAGIGVDNIEVEAATRRGIAVINAPGANTVSAAEHTLALLLALVRQIPQASQSMQNGEWDRSRFEGIELRGRLLGLIGLGRIGAHLAGVARALGMTVAAYDPFLPEARARALRVSLASLEEVLRTADVISLHAPLTDETHHLLDADRLRLMKPTAFVLNTARGALVDPGALVDAIENGRLAGAAFDVFEVEPLPADSPLRRTPGIILTPHLAASTVEAQQRVASEICRSVRLALETGEIGGAVNVPGVSNELLARARNAMDLGRRLGRLAGYLVHGPVTALEVSYGGEDDAISKPVLLAAVEGLLDSMGVRTASMVNAPILAEERGIALARRIGKPLAGFAMSVGVKVQSNGVVVSVAGVLAPGQGGRIIDIDGFSVDIPAAGAIVVLHNRDVAGVIGRVGTVLGGADINIASYHQSRDKRDGGHALAAIVVDSPPGPTVLAELQGDPDVLSVRLAQLDGVKGRP